MKIALIADTHGRLPEVEPVDLCIIAGDVCPEHDHGPVFQRSWLETNFTEWLLNSVPAEKIVGIAGNHDFIFEHSKVELPWTYLQDSGTTYDGLNIYGYPWVPNLPFWAFYKTGQGLYDKAMQIPDDIDILVTHGPPRKIRDKTVPRYGAVHAGDRWLAQRIVKMPRLKLHVFGHIHEGRGRVEIASAKFVNASFVDENYCAYPQGVVYLDL